MGRYKTDEIVILRTHDPVYGQIRMPAIIRYEYPDLPGHYEVNAVIPCGADAAGPRELAWWTICEDEVEQTLGLAVVEHGTQPRVAGRWVFISEDGAIEQPHSHRPAGA